ncbi:L-threonylcarbamoyladenylate synthase [Aureitalea marina]|uniref:Threonylcarbamoyl-AMP synthase n=1 Tax=Aureitalea marina TaxID=930804 RepID=A0A2S7KSW0_9FLAO|nr:L-threonylcarbamoyladenylate synthase [Aureitalea marina]PQB05712.1 threonylcarbamoyl-AMP synthase [Aureitalea marina]
MSIVSSDIDKAIEILQNQDVVAIPTETVYGLAGNIFSEKAIRKIYSVKQRPLFNPLIVHLHSPDQLIEITTHIPPVAKQLAASFWPGPLTLILPKRPEVPDLITAAKGTVAVRIPNHPVTLDLLSKLPFPLAAPSANPFNRISPTSSAHVEAYFGDSISMILEGGNCKAGIESTIVGFEGDQPVIYRLGSISKEDIEKVVGDIEVRNKKEAAPDAPGMLAKHYAPRTKTLLLNSIDDFKEEQNQRVGLLGFTGDIPEGNFAHVEILSPGGNLTEAASNLYKALHKLDGMDLDLILAIRLPDSELGRSVNDRLERAASS